jgi:hypothetical protein
MRLALLLFCVLPACMPEATHEPMTAADGQRAMLVTCPRSRRECLAEATAVCPAGYMILDQESKNGIWTSHTGRTWSEYHGEMLVRCQH